MKKTIAIGVLFALAGAAVAADSPLDVVSGGVRLDWTRPAVDDPLVKLVPPKVRGRLVTAVIPGTGTLPDFADVGSGTKFFQLYDGGRRLPLACWPKEGHLLVMEEGPRWELSHPVASRPKSVAVRSDEPKARLARWAKEPDLWVWGAWRFGWNDSVEKALAVDPDAGTISVSTAGMCYGVGKGSNGGGWYQLRNAFCNLAEPGEWAADRAARRIYMVEPKGGTAAVTAATAENVLRLTGACDRMIEGKIFESCWGSAVVLKACTNVVIRRSVVRNTGGWGVVLENCRNCRVEGCDFYDLGEGGVRIAGGGVRDTLEPGGNAVVNCHIRDFGKVKYNYRPGVSLEGGVGNRVEHCLIHHAKHSAVVFTGNDHYIGWNVIHDVCKGNFDCGAIYTYTMDAWWQRGTVIERNLVHAVGKERGNQLTMAYYIDGFSSGVTLRDNIASRATEGFYQNGGNDNTYVRNISVGCTKPLAHHNLGLVGGVKPNDQPKPGVHLGRGSMLFKGLEKEKALFSNPLWTRRYPNMMRVYEFENPYRAHDSLFAVITNNVWSWSGNPSFQDKDLMEGYQTIADNSYVEDPGFVDYERLNFELKSDSPVRKVLGGGTRFAEMGLYRSPHRVSPPVKFGKDVTPTWRRFDWTPSSVAVRLCFRTKLPEGMTSYISASTNLWEMKAFFKKGDVWETTFGSITPDMGWRQYSFAFVPALDATVRLIARGWTGEKTVYDDFEVSGCTVRNPGFEEPGGWMPPVPDEKSMRQGYNAGGLCGFLGTKDGIEPHSGRKAFLGNGFLEAKQDIAVKVGVPVRISFWAKAYEDHE